MVKLFGTDGIRSRANKFPMDAESVLKIAKLCALRFKDQGNSVLIGKDTRRSCYVFESCFVAGLLSFGMDVMLVGPIPTPAISVLTKSLRCAFGVMISASHNEFCDNGIKFFDKNGLKLLKDDEAFIENGFDQSLTLPFFKIIIFILWLSAHHVVCFSEYKHHHICVLLY